MPDIFRYTLVVKLHDKSRAESLHIDILEKVHDALEAVTVSYPNTGLVMVHSDRLDICKAVMELIRRKHYRAASVIPCDRSYIFEAVMLADSQCEVS